MTNTTNSAEELLPCPFCKSTNIDPEGWMSCNPDGSGKKTGPACEECNGSTDTVERWNKRTPTVSAWDREEMARIIDPAAFQLDSPKFKDSPGKEHRRESALVTAAAILALRPVAPDRGYETGFVAARESAFHIARNGCLVPPDGGSPTEDEALMCDRIAQQIAALPVPATQIQSSDGGVEGNATASRWVSADRKVDAASCSIQEGSHGAPAGVESCPSDALRKALDLALKYLAPYEPGDSRAVSDEFVAMAAVSFGDTSPGVMAVIENGLSTPTQPSPALETDRQEVHAWCQDHATPPQPASPWRDDMQNAPREGDILLFDDGCRDDGSGVVIGRWYVHQSVSGWVTDAFDCNDHDLDPTHWMPLPPPPTNAQGGEA